MDIKRAKKEVDKYAYLVSNFMIISILILLISLLDYLIKIYNYPLETFIVGVIFAFICLVFYKKLLNAKKNLRKIRE